jgi:hypothetical protein
MDSVYLWKTSSEGSSEPDTHIIESQNHPLHIINDAREGFSANFLFSLPVVAIPMRAPRRLARLYRSACFSFNGWLQWNAATECNIMLSLTAFPTNRCSVVRAFNFAV